MAPNMLQTKTLFIQKTTTHIHSLIGLKRLKLSTKTSGLPELRSLRKKSFEA